MITTPIKVGLTPDKSANQKKNNYQKQKQTIAQRVGKKARNPRMQHGSKPGQRCQHSECKNVAIFLK